MIQEIPPPPLPMPTPPEAHALMLTGVGRFAVFADLATIQREGGVVRMRSLQVVEEDFAVGDTRYWGGWSWWRFDCTAGTADRLDFASVAVGGAEGPATPETQPPYPATPGGDAAELMAAACEPIQAEFIASSVADAVAEGRLRLAD